MNIKLYIFGSILLVLLTIFDVKMIWSNIAFPTTPDPIDMMVIMGWSTWFAVTFLSIVKYIKS